MDRQDPAGRSPSISTERRVRVFSRVARVAPQPLGIDTTVVDQHERPGQVPTLILQGMELQPVIEGFVATAEAAEIVLLTESLDLHQSACFGGRLLRI